MNQTQSKLISIQQFQERVMLLSMKHFHGSKPLRQPQFLCFACSLVEVATTDLTHLDLHVWLVSVAVQSARVQKCALIFWECDL